MNTYFLNFLNKSFEVKKIKTGINSKYYSQKVGKVLIKNS
jgi:hypothetical protein